MARGWIRFTVLPNVMYVLCSVSLRIPAGFLIETDMLIVRFI